MFTELCRCEAGTHCLILLTDPYSLVAQVHVHLGPDAPCRCVGHARRCSTSTNQCVIKVNMSQNYCRKGVHHFSGAATCRLTHHLQVKVRICWGLRAGGSAGKTLTVSWDHFCVLACARRGGRGGGVRDHDEHSEDERVFNNASLQSQRPSGSCNVGILTYASKGIRDDD